MRSAGHARSLFLWLICAYAPLCQAAAPAPSFVAHPTRQQLVGAWQLVSIDFSGPGGPRSDPFYQPGSKGIIVYDPSGWMSVQIAGPHRRTWAVPASRSPSAATVRTTQLEAAAFGTYYAYYGTWDYDEATSVVTHHVKSSLIPAETGLAYPQTCTFESGRLVFTVRDSKQGEETTRKKVWERLSGDAK